MSTEQAVIRAHMDRLQGTINQRQKTITEAQNVSSINRPTQNQVARQLSSSSVWATPSPIAARAHDISRARPVAPAQFQPLGGSFPLVTKTSWKLIPSSSQSHRLSSRSTTGSKKLILNNPVTAYPTKYTPFVQSPIISPQASTCFTCPQQPSHSTLSAPAAASADIPLRPLKAAVKQATTNFKKMTLSASAKPFVPAPPKASGLARALNSAPKAAKNEVLIGGISFASDPGGKKLVRTTVPNEKLPTQVEPLVSSQLPDPAAQPAISSVSTNNITPLKASVAGTTYVRTKSGNLVALSALKKFQARKAQDLKKAKMSTLLGGLRNVYSGQTVGPGRPRSWNPTIASRGRGSMSMKILRPPLARKNEQCRFFAKTGACRKGLTCTYQHDITKVAICPRYLRRACPNPSTACPLSHKPNPHNMSHCLHFPRCNKPDCPYPHVTLHSSAVCKDFAELGWCIKGIECPNRHVKECPEFTEKETCSNASCRLPHVINRGQKIAWEEEKISDGDEGKDDAGGDLFFTDLKGKRKADDEDDFRMPLRTVGECQSSRIDASHGHSTLMLGTQKRLKFDQMANNEDFVTFGGSSDGSEDQQVELGESVDSTNLEEVPEDVASSVDSEELHNAIMSEPFVAELEQPLRMPQSDDSMKSSNSRLGIRRRSDLEEGEEVEEGEIFDEDEDGHCSESSEDDEEGIARQLLGDRAPLRI